MKTIVQSLLHSRVGTRSFMSGALGAAVALLAVRSMAGPAVLVNRYGFDNGGSSVAIDSVGGQNGVLHSGAWQTGGEVVLNGATTSFVQLPSNLISPSTISQNAVTLEAWASFGNLGTWARLFDFGNSNGGTGGNYLYFTPQGPFPSISLIASSVFPNGYRDEDGVVLPRTLVNVADLHIVCVVDFGLNRAAIYLNGALAGQDLHFTKNLTDINGVYSYLGKSLYPADPNMVGSIDEFRIYDGALTALEVAASYQSGPNAPHTDPGTVSDIDLDVPSSLQPGISFRARVVATATGLTNDSVEIAEDPALSYSSDNPGVLTVDSDGIITTVALGSATVTATYEDNGVTTTDSQVINVIHAPATLIHRYCFDNVLGNSIAFDSVGGAHGAIQPGALQTGGSVVLNGISSSFVELPSGLIGPSSISRDAITLEAWASFGNLGTWARLFDFGDSDGTTGGNYLFFTPRGVGPFSSIRLIAASAFPRGYQGEDGIVLRGTLANVADLHIVCVVDFGLNRAAIYLNGLLVEEDLQFTKNLEDVHDVYSYLGKSLYSWDPNMVGAIDEFRIYNGALVASEVEANFVAGPDAVAVTIVEPAPGYLATVDEPVQFSGHFTACGAPGTHTAEWIFSRPGLPDATIEGTVDGYTVLDTIEFAEAGIYSIRLVVADGEGHFGEATTVLDDLAATIVVCDPNAGFVTGGGWIWSPAGAFHPELEELEPLEGKAPFGFVCQYKKGAAVPTGQTEFKAGDLNFHSTSYDWLVVSGTRAQFKGEGTINGEGDYEFMLTVINSQIPSRGNADCFRIKIWDTRTGIVIYDNQPSSIADTDLDEFTVIQGGNIVIHRR